MILSFPERVTRHNKERLMGNVINGQAVYPGANRIIKKDGRIFYLATDIERRKTNAKDLQFGDTVERHVIDRGM